MSESNARVQALEDLLTAGETDARKRVVQFKLVAA